MERNEAADAHSSQGEVLALQAQNDALREALQLAQSTANLLGDQLLHANSTNDLEADELEISLFVQARHRVPLSEVCSQLMQPNALDTEFELLKSNLPRLFAKYKRNISNECVLLCVIGRLILWWLGMMQE